VVNADFRALPADFENLPYRESAKWNFGFRPYGKEAAAVLWSDPNVIRDISIGEIVDEKHLATAVYASCDEYGFHILAYGAMKDSADALAKGNNPENIFFECFFIPGDADDPQIINYQPFGVRTVYPFWRFKVPWMRQDRNNRWIFDDMKVNVRKNRNGAVVQLSIPWDLYWDHLPVFQTKKDNFWRLSVIRWGGSFGGETWGGRVHSQTKCGYVRMPDFTPEQQSKIMKNTLLTLWARFQKLKINDAYNPYITADLDAYRRSIDHLPHSWMNINEDPEFKKNVLIPLFEKCAAIGKGLAEFDKLPLEEQKAFYKANAPVIANFRYDIEEAYADYIREKLMKE